MNPEMVNPLGTLGVIAGVAFLLLAAQTWWKGRSK